MPFYWDEAWVYGPAVIDMHEHGPGLLPSSLSVELSRGHPLFFHFAFSVWSLLFGTSVFSLHSFALIISMLLLVALYYSLNQVLRTQNAILAVIILLLQPVFLAQSAMVLPEIMLALFCFLALLFFYQQKNGWYFLFATLAVMTKESGILIVCTTTLFLLITNLKEISQHPAKLFKKIFIAIAPTGIFIVFLLIQKNTYGWFFFPEHIGLMTFDIGEVLNKAERYFSYVFLYQGRNLLFFSTLFALLFQAIRNKKIENGKLLLLLCIFEFGFIAFSAVNFYSDRYMMTTIVIFIVITVTAIEPLIRKPFFIFIPVGVIAAVQVSYLKKQSNLDHNLGFINGIKCHQEMTKFCLGHQLQNETMYAFFMSRTVMTDPRSGYITAEQIFPNVRPNLAPECRYAIISNFDTDGSDQEWRNNPKFHLIQRFEEKTAWIELYEIEN